MFSFRAVATSLGKISYWSCWWCFCVKLPSGNCNWISLQLGSQHWFRWSLAWCCQAKSHYLTHWGRMTHICVTNLTIIGSNNGLSPGRHQAIIWTDDGILLIGPLGTNFREKFNRNSNIFIHENAIESVVCEMAAILSRPQCVKPMVTQFYVTIWSPGHNEFNSYDRSLSNGNLTSFMVA